MGGGEPTPILGRALQFLLVLMTYRLDEPEDGLVTGSVSLGTLAVHPQEGKTSLQVVFITTQKTHHRGTLKGYSCHLHMGHQV